MILQGHAAELPAPALLRVSGLHKAFEGRAVLDDVSLDLRDGQTAVVMGPSGGGKTTLLRCLNLLQEFDSGEISYAHLGVSVAGGLPASQLAALAVRRSVGLVFQEQNLWLDRRVLDNLTLAPRAVLREQAEPTRTRALQFLDRFGLRGREGAWAWQLSGGERQRVAIIRALMMRPRLLLLDEVTSGLDPQLVADVFDLLRELKADGLSMLVVTHQLDFARSFGDVGFLLAGGRVVERGPICRLLDSPGTDMAREFFGVLLRAR